MDKVWLPKWVSKEERHRIVEAEVKPNKPAIINELKPEFFVAEIDGLLHVIAGIEPTKDRPDVTYTFVGVVYDGQEKVSDIRMRKDKDGKWYRND